MEDVLSSLTLVAIHQLCFHEEEEPFRLIKTGEKIKEDNYLRHPILVTPMRNGRYLVLDGVHRCGALSGMNCKRVPVQVVRRHEFSYGSWNHLVPAGCWLPTLFNDPCLPWTDKKEENPFIEVVEHSGRRNYLYLNQVQHEWLHVWHKTTSSYSNREEVTRLPPEADDLVETGKVLVKYQMVAFDTLVELVMKQCVFPAGVTRFHVNGRLLNLQIPLHLLTEQQFQIAEWNKLILSWKESLRMYTEKVYLCEG
ncbi:ParB N-terminal domain-containing protein [Salipaludibacillus sp. HK11]|uniref:ParB N-terminal domain-containing protein n=1 Tax=Salipaludibacillus sp. HK11 TaxID=3394320 RepID=UPI0039FCA54D